MPRLAGRIATPASVRSGVLTANRFNGQHTTSSAHDGHDNVAGRLDGLSVERPVNGQRHVAVNDRALNGEVVARKQSVRADREGGNFGRHCQRDTRKRHTTENENVNK